MYMWMNYIISPKANAEVAQYFGEAPAQSKACDATLERLRRRRLRGPEVLRRTTTPTTRSSGSSVYYWNTPLADCGDDRGDVLQGLQRLGPSLDGDQGVISRRRAPMRKRSVEAADA